MKGKESSTWREKLVVLFRGMQLEQNPSGYQGANFLLVPW